MGMARDAAKLVPPGRELDDLTTRPSSTGGDGGLPALPGTVYRTPLRIGPVRPSDASALGRLFARLDTTWFGPHDLSAEGARAVAHHVGRDVYLVGWLGPEPVAYGMLRGWDEGYAVPSLGVAVRDGYQRRGFGRQMMEALHGMVRDQGGDRVRLRVAPDNTRARRLYDSMGYRQVGVERGELLLVIVLLTTLLGSLS
jgi:GNAT superfamily N-acetyltransferase